MFRTFVNSNSSAMLIKLIAKHKLFRSRRRVFQIQRHYGNRNMITLKERGMYEDIFPDTAVREVTDLLNAKYQTVYAGFDPTADSLHVGNLLILINLLHWQRGGHQVIAVIGGATGKIGDPSGRSTEREAIKSAYVNNNLQGIKENIETIFANHEKYFWPKNEDKLPKIKILNNEEWYDKMSVVHLIGNIGRHLRMGALLSRSSVQTRLASPSGMSFCEFSYQLFQAYDWLHLFKKFDCRFQIGGNDQMGNIKSGYDLIGKICDKSVYGLTLPLITSEMGDKLGKSAGNAVWLSLKHTSAFTFYQFWLRLSDQDSERFLKLFTFDALGSISDLKRQHFEKPEARLMQRRLAENLTLLVHGEQGLRDAEITTKALYEDSISALQNMNAEEIACMFQGATVVEVLPEPGQSILDLCLKTGCFSTNQDAVRIISAGGFYINQKRVTNPSEVLSPSAHRLSNNVSLLRVGKKNYCVVKWL